MAPDYHKLDYDALISAQQAVMSAQSEANEKFDSEKHTIQHELDKRAALRRFADVNEAEVEALREIIAEREASPVEG